MEYYQAKELLYAISKREQFSEKDASIIMS